MADTVQPVILDKGLDTVVPPLLADAGTVLDCLNYEITDTVGYRRIDGYENYDGFPGGDVSYYVRVTITATDPLEQEELVPGSLLYRSDNGLNPVAIGVILGGPFDTNQYDLSPLQNLDAFVLTEEFLLLSGGGFVKLSDSAGYLLIVGEDTELGSTFTVTTLEGEEISVTVDSIPVDGSDVISAEEYLTSLRAYSAALRATVNPAPAPVAGLYWFDDRLYAAINAPKVTITVEAAETQPTNNMRVRWNGQVYYTFNLSLEEEGSTNSYSVYLLPSVDADVTDDDLVQIDYNNNTIQTWSTDLEENGSIDSESSDYAVMGYFNNPDISTSREFVYLPTAYQVGYDTGSYSSGLGPASSFNENYYYIVAGGGTEVMRVRLMSAQQTDGTWAGDDSSGTVSIIIDEVLEGTRDFLQDDDELHSEYPVTGDSRILTLDGDPTIPYLAGTRALDVNDTRYQWITANFYGQADSNAAWGVNGAGRSFWVTRHGYGTINAIDDDVLDVPKYLAYHANSLVLGYAKGSILRSVVGEPTNFDGADGAIEVATGDNITGLLEMPGDTIAVLGRRSIRKLVGTTSDDLRLGTISSNSGCFDYTAVMIGQDAIFTGVNGITSLQQTAAYGDFAGVRLSSKISNWLRPKLIVGFRASESGGTLLAYPVRNKNQYRLVLASGEVVVLTITSEGPKIMKLSHNLTAQTRVPYVWSSEIDQHGQERIHVVWKALPRSSQVVELDTGWGFNGVTFSHYFELAHLFFNSGANFGGVEGVRLHGQGQGIATLNVQAAGIETDFNQAYNTRVQDISIPDAVEAIYDRFRPVTNSVDHANWGLGIKLKIEGTLGEGSEETEPPHICQALVLKVRTEGVQDG